MGYLLLLPLLSAFVVAPLSFLDSMFGKFRGRLSLMLSFLPAILITIFYLQQEDIYYQVRFSSNLVIDIAFGVGNFSFVFGLTIFLIAPLSILLLPKKPPQNTINSRFYVLLHCSLFGCLIVFCAKDFISFFIGLGILSWCVAGMLCSIQGIRAKGYLLLMATFEIFVFCVIFCCFVLYGSSGSFLIDNNLSSFKQLSNIMQNVVLFSFFSSVLIATFFLSLTGFFVFYGMPRALIFFFVVVLYQIPIFTLVVINFVLLLPYADSKITGLFWDILAIFGSMQIIVGYMGVWFYRQKMHELKLFLLNLAESGFILTFLCVLDKWTIGGFMLLLTNHALSLALVYFVAYYQQEGNLGKPIMRLRHSWLGFFALANFCGVLPFFGFSGKLFLLEILWDRNYFVIFALVLVGIFLSFLFFAYRLKEFSILKDNTQSIPNNLYAVALVVVLLLLSFFPYLQYQLLESLNFSNIAVFSSTYPHLWVEYNRLSPFLLLGITLLWCYLRFKKYNVV